MELQRIAENTYFISEPGIGVYRFEDCSCLLVDTGNSREAGSKVLELLQDHGLTVRGVFNTHFHADHCAGNRLIQEQTQCRIIASSPDAAIIQNTVLAPVLLYSAYPPRALNNWFFTAEPSVVTDVVGAGNLEFLGVTFQVIDLKGHTLGQVGVVTPDGVAFLGDSLLAGSTIEEYPLLCLADAGSQLETFDILEKTDFACAVLSHTGPVPDLIAAIEQNRRLFHEIRRFVLEVTRKPRSREEIISLLVESLSLPLNTVQYYLIHSTVSAFLSYLCGNRSLRATPADGFLKYTNRQLP